MLIQRDPCERSPYLLAIILVPNYPVPLHAFEVHSVQV